MSFTYPTATVGSNKYAVYGNQDDADAYLAANMGTAASAWNSTTAFVKAQALVSSTRWLDAGQWQGQMTDVTNALQFPRAGLTYQNGQAVDPTTLPPPLVNACFELAAALVDNPDLRIELQNPVPKDLSAGSVHLSFFRPLGAVYGAQDVQVLSFFPMVVMNLVGLWLSGTGLHIAPITKGTHKKSDLKDDLGLIHGF